MYQTLSCATGLVKKLVSRKSHGKQITYLSVFRTPLLVLKTFPAALESILYFRPIPCRLLEDRGRRRWGRDHGVVWEFKTFKLSRERVTSVTIAVIRLILFNVVLLFLFDDLLNIFCLGRCLTLFKRFFKDDVPWCPLCTGDQSLGLECTSQCQDCCIRQDARRRRSCFCLPKGQLPFSYCLWWRP